MTIPVFVNDRCLTVIPGQRVADLLDGGDPAWALARGEGRLAVTDGRGLPLDLATPVAPGLIVRVVVSARRVATDDRPG